MLAASSKKVVYAAQIGNSLIVLIRCAASAMLSRTFTCCCTACVMGPDFILLNISLKFDHSADAEDKEKTIGFMEERIRKSCPSVKRIFTEVASRQGRS